MKKLCSLCFEKYDEALNACPHCKFEKDSKTEETPHLISGTVLKEIYVVGKVLGYGGFGITYLGWNTVLEQKIAIKEYLPSEFSTRMPGQSKLTIFNGEKSEQFHDGAKKFVEEATRLAKFRSTDGVVQIFESFCENNTAYIIMEYLDGQTLTKHLEKTGLISADETISLMMPVIKSLQTVHSQGIIHRDIAPDNIIITKSGEVKLIDFGAARYATTSRSRSLTVVIKQGYSPEEQYRSRGDQGAWTDVYAIAATMYRMITGETPPDAMERRAFLEGKNKNILDSISKRSKQINKNQENAILNALNVRIEDRTSGMQAFEKELTSEEAVKRKNNKIKKTDTFKWPKWAKFSIPIAASFVVILFVLFASGVIGFNANLSGNINVPKGMVRVPSIVSSEESLAIERLTNLDLLYNVINKEYSEDIEAGLILSQDLQAGSIVAVKTMMKVVISGGKVQSDEYLTQKDENGQIDLTDVQYKTQKEAVRLLELQGMKVKIVEQVSETVAAGIVISQNPAAGTKLDLGTEVTLVVSTGSTKNTDTSSTVQSNSTANSEIYDSVDNYSYIINGNNVTITGYKGSGGDIVIPSKIEGKSVTHIGDYAFSGANGWNGPFNFKVSDNIAGCTALTGIVIPNSVISIGDNAFVECSSLTNMTIPNSVTSIGGFAFYDCENLKSITIPNSVKTIGEWAFCLSGLTSITIPNSITSISESTFYWCSDLKSVTIPSSVTSIGETAFALCKSLTNITIPNSVKTIGDYAFWECTGLTGIIIPDGVTVISVGAFIQCGSLISIAIPNSVTSIGERTFDGCSSLTNVIIPGSVTNIADSAFKDCPLLTISGYTGSYAQTYAVNRGIPFNAM